MRQWMADNFKILVQPEDQMPRVLSEFVKFKGDTAAGQPLTHLGSIRILLSGLLRF